MTNEIKQIKMKRKESDDHIRSKAEFFHLKNGRNIEHHCSTSWRITNEREKKNAAQELWKFFKSFLYPTVSPMTAHKTNTCEIYRQKLFYNNQTWQCIKIAWPKIIRKENGLTLLLFKYSMDHGNYIKFLRRHCGQKDIQLWCFSLFFYYAEHSRKVLSKVRFNPCNK